MANAAGMLKESIWRDKDFRALPRTAQATYCELISQKDLDRAGMQPLQVSKWAKGCDEITDADIGHDLKVLEERRFVFVDDDTDELFVRSYMRHCEITRYPNILKNALRCAGLVASVKLRRELAVELRRLRRADATRVADLIDPDPPNGSETNPNPSRTVPEGLNGSETLTEPQGYGTGSGSVLSVVGQVGKAAENSRTDETAPNDPSDEPPPQTCPRHINHTDPPPCRACREAREIREAWDAEQSQRGVRDRAAFWAAVRDCPECDEHGHIDDDDQVTKCPNHDWELIHA